MTQAQVFMPKASAIYTNDRIVDAEDKSTQLRHLALIGLAAADSNMNIKHIDCAFQSLFEVIARLAEEVTEEVAYMKVQLKRS